MHTALKRMTELNIDEIPVVRPDDHTQLVGTSQPAAVDFGLHHDDPVAPSPRLDQPHAEPIR